METPCQYIPLPPLSHLVFFLTTLVQKNKNPGTVSRTEVFAV